MVHRPSQSDLERAPIDVQLYLAGLIFFSVTLPNLIQRIEMWVFPPAIFCLTFLLARRGIPADHPIALWAALAISFMALTLTLFMLRPPKKVERPDPWIKGS